MDKFLEKAIKFIAIFFATTPIMIISNIYFKHKTDCCCEPTPLIDISEITGIISLFFFLSVIATFFISNYEQESKRKIGAIKIFFITFAIVGILINLFLFLYFTFSPTYNMFCGYKL